MPKQARIATENTVGSRLERVREYMGYDTQTAFAAFLGVKLSRYNNVARDAAPLSLKMEEIIVRKCPGVTALWLRHGTVDGLSVGVARALGEL